MEARHDPEFDGILEEVMESLPGEVRELLDEVAIIVEDEPSPEILREMGIDPGEIDPDLCGLHSGTPLSERSVAESQTMPDCIHIFRGPIRRLAGKSRRALAREIRITLLHEIGHHFGMTEEDMERLGYE